MKIVVLHRVAGVVVAVDEPETFEPLPLLDGQLDLFRFPAFALHTLTTYHPAGLSLEGSRHCPFTIGTTLRSKGRANEALRRRAVFFPLWPARRHRHLLLEPSDFCECS